MSQEHITVKLALDKKTYQVQLLEAQKDVANFSQRIGSSISSTLIASFRSLGGLFGALALKRMLEEFLRYTEQLKNLSDSLGVSTDFLQRFINVGERSGQTAQTMETALGRLAKSLTEAQQGTKEQVEAFARYGIKLRDANGYLLTTEEVLYAMSDAMKEGGNDANNIGMAFDLMGRKGFQMIGILKSGSEELKGAMAKQHIMGAEVIAQAEVMANQFDTMNQGLRVLAGWAITAYFNLTKFLGALSAKKGGLFSEWTHAFEAYEDVAKMNRNEQALLATEIKRQAQTAKDIEKKTTLERLEKQISEQAAKNAAIKFGAEEKLAKATRERLAAQRELEDAETEVADAKAAQAAKEHDLVLKRAFLEARLKAGLSAESAEAKNRQLEIEQLAAAAGDTVAVKEKELALQKAIGVELDAQKDVERARETSAREAASARLLMEQKALEVTRARKNLEKAEGERRKVTVAELASKDFIPLNPHQALAQRIARRIEWLENTGRNLEASGRTEGPWGSKAAFAEAMRLRGLMPMLEERERFPLLEEGRAVERAQYARQVEERRQGRPETEAEPLLPGTAPRLETLKPLAPNLQPKTAEDAAVNTELVAIGKAQLEHLKNGVQKVEVQIA